MKKTVLYEHHKKAGAKIVDFSGWAMPVQYEGLKQEHLNTRENGGVFDVSHMGEIRVQGPNALKTLEWLTTNHVGVLNDKEAQYTLITNENGGIVDDVIIYCLKKDEDYLVCVNAANREKDWNWFQAHNQGAQLVNESDKWAQIAVQGPQAFEGLKEVMGEGFSKLPFFGFTWATYQQASALVARTGYTGEAGVEVFIAADQGGALWDDILRKGEPHGLKPVCLGARDTFRLEASLCLYGQDIDDTTLPHEARLGWVVKAQNKDFLGKPQVMEAKSQGVQKKLIGFEMLERGVPRHDYKLFSFDNEEIGSVTSGTHSPSLGKGIGLGYLATPYTERGTEFWVEIRSRKLKAKVVKTPFIKKN